MEDTTNNEVIDMEIRYMHDEYLSSREKLIERRKEAVQKVISKKEYTYRIEGINYYYMLESGVTLIVRANDSDISHSLNTDRILLKEEKRDMFISSLLEDVDSFTDSLMKDLKEIEWMYNEFRMLKNNLYEAIITELRDWVDNTFDISYLLPLVISIGETKYIITENEDRGDAAYNPSENKTKIDLKPYIEYSL